MKKRLLGTFALAVTLLGGGLVSEVSAAKTQSTTSTYIIVFNRGTNPTAEAARLRDQGYSVRHTYSNVLSGVAVDLPTAAVQGLSRSKSVQLIEPDGVVTASASQSGATWGLDRSDQRNLPLNGSFAYPDSAGQGVNAYILDTGVLSSHVDFSGRVRSGFTSISDGRGTEDCNGHGTHVAGTVAGSTWGLAKKANIVPVRVLDCAGSGTWSGVLAGMDWVAANAVKPAVANMSLGGGASSSIDTAVANMHNSGVTVVVAAGNSTDNACNYSPARAGVAITVGATTSTDARASYSNFGSCLDIFAPGSSIKSAWYTSSTATNTISGTSMASPHVAGAAALLLGANGALSPTQVRNALVASATPNLVTSAEVGSPNLLLFVDGGSGSTTPTTTVAPTTTTIVPTTTTAAPTTTIAPTTTTVTTTTVPVETTTVAPTPVPGAFSKSAPVNGATNVSRRPTLTWTASADATSYQVCISTSQTCSSWLNAGTSTSAVVSNLKGRTTYFWQVRAVNASGTTVAAEVAWRFTTTR
ncbi:MAG: S8 family serine peptidase [Actinomycetota bacterium]